MTGKRAGNADLNSANKNKNDEFYTQLDDITAELQHYRRHFKGKVVYCNCDDPTVSNFYKYFSSQFKILGLKKLIASCYKNRNRDLFSAHDAEQAIWLEYKGSASNKPDKNDIAVKHFKGDGDFRSAESINLLKQADIVVTNPPFSLFREYVSQLVEYNKKFILVGHQNAITYSEIFPLIKENKLWLGFGFKGGAGHFISNYEDYAAATSHKEGMIRVSGVNWFTNLKITKRQQKLELFKKYTAADYPAYDNYAAIEVGKTKEIPHDYRGVMGVPITFVEKYNPEQFEIIGMGEDNGRGQSGGVWLGGSLKCLVNGKAKFKRIFIKRKAE